MSEDLDPVDCDSGSCGCLQTIRENLRKEHGESAYISLRQYLRVSDGRHIEVLGMSPLEIHFQDGKRWKKSHVAFTHCPFCGTPYSAKAKGGDR